jgi:hypothetical protein
MASRVERGNPAAPAIRTPDLSRVYQEGIVAGTLGAATIAVWFLILDTLSGRPFYTPTVLGSALFHGGAGLDSPETLPISFEMVVSFTWVHFLVFGVIGGIASHLLALVERTPNTGFGIILLFVVFGFGFVAAAMVVAEQVLAALAWPAILLGNLLAAAVMVLYFRRRHPNLTIEP